ncbi:FecR domain-containing protein [Novosphingobium lindaniclasticum]
MRDPRTEYDAADWHAQVLGGDVDWEEFAAWLDADPSHQATYDRLAMLDTEVAEWARYNGVLEAAKVVPHSTKSMRPWWIGGAIAASLVALVASVPLLTRPAGVNATVYATANAQKTIDLGQGSQIHLDARSQLAMGSGGHVRIDKGAAYFDIRGNAPRKLEIASGDFIVRDIGTRFTVARNQGKLFVAVEQGLVDISWHGDAAAHLKAGQAFEGDEQTGSSTVERITPEAVGSWRNGRLVYDEASLSTVASDLARHVNVPVEVDPGVANLKLSGVFSITNGSDLVDQITAILPVEAQRSGGRIRLVARAGR